MSQYLLYGGLKQLNQKEIDKFDKKSIEENSSNGYILEVNLKYPDKLHNFHNDYPLALEKFKISNDMLSKYYSDIAKNMGQKSVVLINQLQIQVVKVKYIGHYINLQLYLSVGLKLNKIH